MRERLGQCEQLVKIPHQYPLRTLESTIALGVVLSLGFIVLSVMVTPSRVFPLLAGDCMAKVSVWQQEEAPVFWFSEPFLLYVNHLHSIIESCFQVPISRDSDSLRDRPFGSVLSVSER